MYQKLEERILGKLAKIVGEENVITNREKLEPYSHDEVSGLAAWPEAAVKVRNTDQVARILKLANQERVPVTPRGLGTGLSGGAVPVRGGLVLSLEEMAACLEIDNDNLMITVEPGMITGELHKQVEKQGLFYPPDPASLESCSIGGNVAEGAAGPRTLKYGVTRHYVTGLEVVLPSGEIATYGGKIVKNATGYDFMQLLIGSEGTLGIITKIILRLLPLPLVKVDLLVPFDDLSQAAQAVTEIIRQKKIIPATIEFMENACLRACEKILEKKLPFSDAAAHLLIELDGNKKEEVEADYATVGELCLEKGARDVLVADTSATQERLWEGRRSTHDALRDLNPLLSGNDVIVPRMQIPALIASLKKLASEHHVDITSFGHAGDGNVHAYILNREWEEKEWKEKLPGITEDLFRLVVSLGGTISSEHGIGYTRRRYLPLALSSTQIEVMRKIKDSLDPNRILNPDKII